MADKKVEKPVTNITGIGDQYILGRTEKESTEERQQQRERKEGKKERVTRIANLMIQYHNTRNHASIHPLIPCPSGTCHKCLSYRPTFTAEFT